MSLLTNYEGLRHQIERLVRENEELKKLVRLIRENHELKSAIKTQAGGLNLSAFTSGLGEAVAASAPRQGNSVFLPSAAATVNEPTLEEMGLTALAPLADMLSSPQPGPLVSPLTGPLSSLLTGPAPVSQSTPISSLLNGPLPSHLPSHLPSPLAVTPATGALTSPLGSHLTGSVATPTMGTLASSLGMISTGSLTPSSPLAGPLAVSQSGPLMAPVGGPVTVSLSSPLLSSTAAPIGVSQNLLASPMGNLVLSEAPRVRLPEPHSSAATPKVPLPAEHARMTQDPEPPSVAFVGTPLQTSTPMGSVATPIPSTAFSFSASDPRAQPSAPQGQMVPAAVPASPQLPVLTGTTTPAPQPPGGYTSSTTHVAPQSPARVQHSSSRPLASPHSPPRNAHSSPSRTASSPASVNDTRAPSTAEPARKSILELERKLTHRKTSKFADSSREPKQLAWERLVGEIAFQLDRRILSSIFPERVRLYGFTVSNIPEKIIQASLNPSDHKLDEELCQTLTQRYVSIMNRLQSLGYNGRVHPALTEQLVNAYGILRERPELAASEGGSYTVDFLQRVLVETVHPSMLTDALLLLSCLNQLAHDDGKPMFIW